MSFVIGLALLLIVQPVRTQNETLSLISSLCDDECTFEPKSLNSKNYKKWPKSCETVCSQLHIDADTDLSESQLTAMFKNMRKLVGSLVVMQTKYTSGKFLAGLESVECDDSVFTWILNSKMTELGLLNLTSIACRIHIISNKKMTRLNLPNLRNFEPTSSNNSRVDITINSLAPTFCVTIEEMANFLSDEDVDVGYLPGGYCEITTSTNETEKVCGFENSTLSEMESGCVHVRGDVIVESGDEEHVAKLETVKSIFGSLLIDGTNLTNTDFLGDLQYVASLKEDGAAIEVRSNPDLSNVTFPSLKRVRSDNRYSIVFNNNSQQLLMDPDICFGIRNTLNLTDSFSPTIDGQSCERIQADAIVRANSPGSTLSVLTTVFFSVLLLSRYF